jgi:hypothetical protein
MARFFIYSMSAVQRNMDFQHKPSEASMRVAWDWLIFKQWLVYTRLIRERSTSFWTTVLIPIALLKVANESDHTKNTARKTKQLRTSLFKKRKREQKWLLYSSPSLATYSYLYLWTIFYFDTDHFSAYRCQGFLTPVLSRHPGSSLSDGIAQFKRS